MHQETKQPETLLQLSINEVMGQFDADKEKMFDILDQFFSSFLANNEVDPGDYDKGLQLYFFFNRVVRTMEITFEA